MKGSEAQLLGFLEGSNNRTVYCEIWLPECGNSGYQLDGHV